MFNFKLLLIYILNHFVKWNFMAYLFYRYFKDNFNLCVNLMFIYTSTQYSVSQLYATSL